MNGYLKAAEIMADIFAKAPVVIAGFFVIVNIVALALYYADKQKAIKHKWRIPEATLILVGFAGGSFGAFAGMRLFRHKTKHAKFVILIPLFMVLQTAVIVTIAVGMLR